MTIPVKKIENGGILWMKVNTDHRDNDRLWIFTGIAILDTWNISDNENWVTENVKISMKHIRDENIPTPPFSYNVWLRGIATASPASIRFRETVRRDQMGFAINSVNAYEPGGPDFPDVPQDYGVNAQVALVGSEASFYRISFQLNVITRGYKEDEDIE